MISQTWVTTVNSKIVLLVLSMVGAAIPLGGCASIPFGKTLPEQPVTLIPLDGPIADDRAELSGLAWQADTLILLPQYPDRFGKEDGVLFAIPKAAILDFLDGRSQGPLVPAQIEFFAPGLKESIDDFEGYEAIGFSGGRVYLTIEAGKNEHMLGYLAAGEISADQREIHIDASRLVKIPPQVLLDNRSDEALVVMEDRILTFFEVNGTKLNPGPVAHVFGLDLSPQGMISFPNLEYRLTDATLAADGRIWAINKVAPGDKELRPKSDPLAKKYGRGSTHKKYPQVERLVALNNQASGITLADLPPIPLALIEEARNWEGLVALDERGFLLVTDNSPETMLVFVPMP
jgi:hypothetical protein